ncbi:MAG: HAMP domain-containing histidine kinase, partial [Candidatus Obscuribacterales bacterium]|nr:HAMP domain-containing histidine kinase [Candidatus Obscuribacterales bacterium]
MKIIHKGLILVGVPLVFGITFVSVLFCGISDANRIFQHELLLKDAMITDNVTTRSTFAAKICAMSYLFTRQPIFKERLNANLKEAESSYKKLQTLLKNEPIAKIPAKITRKEMITGDASYLMQMNAFMQKLEHMADRETSSALKSMNWLQGVLIGGMLGSTVITVALAVFFCLNITSRLLMIMDNTMNLSSGRPLNPPLKGTDEIAELDQFLFKSAREIRELERFKQEMVGVVSHELKSPLSSVEMFLYSLSSGVFGELNIKAKDKVQRTHQNVLQLMSLVKELLYLDRLELKNQPEVLKGQDIVKIAVDTAKELSEQLGIKIVIKELDGTLYADRNRMVQVIVNLLSNAMKSSPPKGSVTIETREINGCFECRVSDNGRGIPDEFLNQVFEPFKQIGAGSESNKKGTGLGLTISRSIVNQHGGHIGVESAEGKGNTFWFKIPSSSARKADSHAKDDSSYSFDPSVKAVDPNSIAMHIPTKEIRVGRFSLLKQGLIIISVPLIFQFAFVAVIGGLLFQIQQHAHREEHSKEILNTLNRIEQEIVVSSHYGVMYIFSHDSSYLQSWQRGKQNAINMIEKLRLLSSQDSA